jgi:hypothetical protein
MLEYHRFHEAKKSAGLSISWENTAKPVLATNRGKFANQLSSQEIFLFEALAFVRLQQLGYELVNDPEQLVQKSAELARERLTYRLAELAQKIRIEIRHLLHDRNSVARIRKNCFITYIRLQRKYSRPDA